MNTPETKSQGLPAIQVTKFGPTRPEQVEVGGYYLVRGTNSFGEPIPTQLIRIETAPKHALVARTSTTVGAFVWCEIDGFFGIWRYHQHDYPLGAVNVTGQGEHGVHDRHLERIDPDDWEKAHRGGYIDLLRGVHSPPILTL